MSDTNTFDRRTVLKTSGAAVASAATGGLASGTAGDRDGRVGTASTDSISDSLSGPDDRDCWTWACEYSGSCSVCLELSGPSDADFDLYVNVGGRSCPTPTDYDYGSYSAGSQESICIDELAGSTELYILVDSYSGSGEYSLTITEYE